MHQGKQHTFKTLCFLVALVMMFVVAMPLVIAQENEAVECARVDFDPTNFEHVTGLVCMDCHTFHQANGTSLLIPGYEPEPLEEEEEDELELDEGELLGDDSEQEPALDEEKEAGQETDQEKPEQKDDNQEQDEEQDPVDDDQDEDSGAELENDDEPEVELEQE